MRQEMLIIPWLTLHAVLEDGDHALVSVGIEMVDLVSLVQHVGQQIRRRRIDNGGRDDVRHVPEVLVLGHSELGVGVELPDGREMDVSTEDGHADGPLGREVLQVLDDDLPLLLVVSGRPVIVQIIQDLDTAVKVVQRVSEQAQFAQSFDRIEQSGSEAAYG